MTEVTIEVDKNGASKTRIRTIQGEDPACLQFAQMKEEWKGKGIIVEGEVEVGKHTHQHTHEHA
jgi:hypothetical protein